MQAECEQTAEDQLHLHKEHRDIQYPPNIQLTSNLTSNLKHRTSISKAIKNIAEIFKI